jgi:hypothetical protein
LFYRPIPRIIPAISEFWIIIERPQEGLIVFRALVILIVALIAGSWPTGKSRMQSFGTVVQFEYWAIGGYNADSGDGLAAVSCASWVRRTPGILIAKNETAYRILHRSSIYAALPLFYRCCIPFSAWGRTGL